jgi:hypothetical protein
VKFLLFGAITVNVVASLYLMLIAPIMITGWNNTTFHTDAAVAVTALLIIGLGGSILGFVWRNTRPGPALLVTAIPAAIVVAGCLWTMMD